MQTVQTDVVVIGGGGAGLRAAIAVAESKEEFEKGYRSHLQSVVKGLRAAPPEKTQSLPELQAVYEKEPTNVDVAAKLARLRHLPLSHILDSPPTAPIIHQTSRGAVLAERFAPRERPQTTL